MKKQGTIYTVAVLLLCAVILGGGTYLGIHYLRNNTVRVACVGDSITKGLKLENPRDNSYPSRLQSLLGKHYVVMNYGKSGAAVQRDSQKPYLKQDEYLKSIDYQPDMVLLMLGTNDTKKENWRDIHVFMQDYEAIVQKYQELASKPRIYLMTPAAEFKLQGKDTYHKNMNDEYAKEIAEAILAYGEEKNIPVIDIYEATKDHPEFFEADGIHPDEKGAELIAETVYAELLK